MEIKILQPNDFHHHLRDNELLHFNVKHCFNKFKNVIVMPNLIPPIITIHQALNYRKRINKYNIKNGNPLMTLYLNQNINIEDIRKFKYYPEMIGIKYYPKNVTTNSQNGINNIKNIFFILKIMEEEDIPLLIHGETNNKKIDIFKKEEYFINNELLTIIKNFPKLRIVLEHISTKIAVNFVLKHNNIYATITPHHLVLDRNDIFDGGIHPHLYCLPILKKKEDKICLIKAAISGNNKFFLGTDNAPHLEKDKISSCGCAGIFNSPVAIEIITELFDKNNSLHNLEKFMSTNGCDFYKIPYNKEYIRLKKEDWIVPNRYGNLIPLYNGKKIKWKIKNF
jgi:dihydroorotase